MSSQSLAALRKSASEDLQRLADEHLQHEYDKHFPVIFLTLFANTILSLRQSDRDTLEASDVTGLVGYKFDLCNQPIAYLKLRTGSRTGSTGSTR